MDVQVTTTAPTPYKWYVDNVLVKTAYTITSTINGGGCGSHTLRVDVSSTCGNASASTFYTRSCSLFSVSPNPAGDEVTISTKNTGTVVKAENSSANLIESVNLIDLRGVTKKSWRLAATASPVKLSLADLAPGNYILQIRTKNEVQSIPVMKK
jgi:hypothetical protein